MEYFVHIGILVCIFAILGTSFNVIMGYVRLFSLAHAAMFGVGAYSSALLAFGVTTNTGFCILLSGAITALMGGVIALPALRVKSYYLAVLTLGFQQVMHGLMVNLLEVTGGESGIAGIPRPIVFGMEIVTKGQYLGFYAGITLICVLFAWRLTASPFGRALKAIREDEDGARSLGKNILYFKMATFMFSGAMAGVAGSLYAQYVTYINPTSFGFSESIFIIAIVVFGGTGSLLGSVVGAIILVSVPEFTRFIRGFSEGVVGPIRIMLFGAMLIFMIRFRPEGIIPEYFFSRKSGSCGGGRKGKDEFNRVEMEKLGRAFWEKRSVKGSDTSQGNDEVILSVRRIRKSFGGLQVLVNVSMDLKERSVTALIGPNGAGKTTLFNLITGNSVPDAGEVIFRGKNITGLPPHRGVTYGFTRTFQDLKLFPRMTVLDTVLSAIPDQKGEKLFASFLPNSKQEQTNLDTALGILGFAGLYQKRHELTENLSYAEQKMLSIARLLGTDADFLLLDEPASGLDKNKVDDILALIKRLPAMGKTVCIVEHNLDVVRSIANWVYFLADGQVIKQGTPDEIFSDAKLADIYFGGGLWDSK